METPLASSELPVASHVRYKSASKCVSADLAGEVAILDSESGVYYGMNEVGAAIWQFIATERTLSEITDMIFGIYNVDRSQCESDVLHILEQLKSAGLIHIDATAG